MHGFDETTSLTLGAALFASLALLLVFASVRGLRRRRVVRASALGLSGGSLLLAAALLGSIALHLHTYQRFTAEQTVAELQFAAAAPQLFNVSLQLPDGTSQHTQLAGDEWQLDARVLKWSGLATVLGFQPVYRLDRLSGRYHNVEQERSAPRTIETFKHDRGLDLWSAARRSDAWIPWVDAVYGSAAYLPMRDGAHFRVTIGNNGLLARPLNDSAIKAVADWD